jgi:hypothetical protein
LNDFATLTKLGAGAQVSGVSAPVIDLLPSDEKTSEAMLRLARVECGKGNDRNADSNRHGEHGHGASRDHDAHLSRP